MAQHRVLGLHGRMADHIVLLFAFFVSLNWSSMVVLNRIQGLMFDVVHAVYECILPPLVICNLWLLRCSEQHLRVLGLCLMALDVHHRMLDSLIMGAVFNRCCVPIRYYRLYIMATLFDVCTWKSFVLKPGSEQRGLLLVTPLRKGLPPTIMQ